MASDATGEAGRRLSIKATETETAAVTSTRKTSSKTFTATP